MTLGLLIPGIYTAMGWTMIAHPRIGLVNRWLVDLFNLDDGPINIATPIGMGFVQGLSLVAAGVHPNVADVPRHESVASKKQRGSMAWASARICWRITLPLARPGILGGGDLHLHHRHRHLRYPGHPRAWAIASICSAPLSISKFIPRAPACPSMASPASSAPS